MQPAKDLGHDPTRNTTKEQGMQDENTQTAPEFPWEEPPKPGLRRRVDTAALRRQLMADPNRRARIRTHEDGHRRQAQRYVYSIKHGQTPWCQPAGAFEAVDRISGDEHVIYARYVGTGGQS